MIEHDVAELAYTLGRAPERVRLALHALLHEMGAEVPAAARK